MAATLSGPDFNVTIFAESRYHSLTSSLNCVWMMSAKLTKMLGSTENVANCATWSLRGSLDENTGFSSLPQTFRQF